MNIFAEFRIRALAALTALMEEGVLPQGLDLSPVTLEPPRDPAHGDLALNAALALARAAKMKPRAIAEPLAEKLRADPRIEAVEIAGPGFLNIRLAPKALQETLGAILQAGEAYGRSDLGAGARINVEYVSVNPTGPLHMGHTRGAVFGDALASLLEFTGHKVTREYYINDGGAQVDVLARSSYQRYREAHGQTPEIHEGLYPGDYLVPVGEALKANYGDRFLEAPEEEWLPVIRAFAIEAMMDLIREDLAALNVEMDVFFSEKSLYETGKIEAALKALEDKGLIYQGVLEPPKGKTPDDWEPREQTLFRATEFGDDVDRPIRKSDGSWTYFAPDIAYHYDKLQRSDALIDVFGADHGGYVKRMKAAVRALSEKNEDLLDIKLCQLVKLFRGGEPVKMSKRAGNFISLREFVEEAGPDAARFMMLTRKNDAPLDFDFEKAREQSRDNPVYYVQYAHARLSSALRRGAETLGLSEEGADLTLLDHPSELGLIRKLAEWPRLVAQAALSHEPHRIAFYLYDLAAQLHGHWHLGNGAPELRFVQEDAPEATKARLALARGTQAVIASGLAILGVTPAQEMR